MNAPEGHDLTAALHLATALTDARGKRYRVLADAAEHKLAAELVGRISARVAAATGTTQHNEDTPPVAATSDHTVERQAYTPHEVGELLGLHSAAVRRLIHNHQLRARRVGNRYRVSAQALRDYLDGRDDPLASAS